MMNKYQVIIFTDRTDNIGVSKVIGAYKIAQALRENGYTCLVVDHFHTWSIKEIKQLMQLTVGEETRLVGFSNTFFANSNVEKNPDGSTPPYTPIWGQTICPQGEKFEQEMMSYLRETFPWVQTIVGGSRANPNTSSSSIDYVSMGYSEYSIVNLMNHLTKGTELTDSWKNISGKVILDDRKGEKYDFDSSRMEWLPIDIVNAQVLPLEVGRGCVFRCKFCSFPMNGKKQLDFIRNADQLAQEMQENYDRYGITTYNIVDDTFNDNEWKLEELHRAFQRLTFQPRLWAYIRLDLVSRNVEKNMKLLYEIGLRAVHFGIETLNPPTGKVIGKGHDRAKQIEAIKYIRETYGNRVLLYGTFIIGLPHETEEQVTNTFEMLCRQEVALHAWKFFPLCIYRQNQFSWSSEIDRDYAKFGYRELPVSEYTYKTPGHAETYVNWESDLMNFFRANQLANQFNKASDPLIGMHGNLTFDLLSLGYTFEELAEQKHSTFDFHQAEIRKQVFDRQYREQLLDMLRHSNDAVGSQ